LDQKFFNLVTEYYTIYHFMVYIFIIYLKSIYFILQLHISNYFTFLINDIFFQITYFQLK